jgi:hypothetical protein
MARHYIGVSSRGPTVLRNIRTGPDGNPLVLMHQDDTTQVTVNFAAFLEAGETILTATLDATGVTASRSLSSPNVVLTLSDPGTDGTVDMIVTTSTGDVTVMRISARQIERYTDEALFISDYA